MPAFVTPLKGNNMSSQIAISFCQVSQRFALDKVDFNLRAGQVSGLIGPDGAGKTTLMRLAAGLLVADEGDIQVLGIDVRNDPLAVQSAIGYMPQRFGLYEDLTVAENLDLYADLQGVSLVRRRTRYDELLPMTGLADFQQRLAGQLSGGMKQKLGLACALIRSPRLLLLDEPTVGVDPVSRRELWAIIYRQVNHTGMTVPLSTAYLDEAQRCADIILLHGGRCLAQGRPESFSAALHGRVFEVRSRDESKRQLQARLNQRPEVIDALVEDEQVRVIARAGTVPDMFTAVDSLGDILVRAVEPVFEDAFIARLKEETATGKRAGIATAHALPKALPSDNDRVISVRNLERHFGRFVAVKGVSFDVSRGEVFGLLGANGAGKSTTFRMLCGLLPVTSGEARVAGVDLRHGAARARARLGYMAQRFALYVDLTVLQNLRFFASAYELGREQAKRRIGWALAAFELEAFKQTSAGDLPLGYKQRLAMAAALMHEPDILFLDEPTSGVDPLARREFWQRINALAESGVTILVTTHFMDEANYCDRLLIMADGEMLATGSPVEMKARFHQPGKPSPTMEDAFIALIEGKDRARSAA